jgi:hypothetical protein
MESKVIINQESEQTRLTDIAKLLHEVNERLCDLYKRDSIYTESPALYKKLVEINDKLLSKIAKKTNTAQTLSYGNIAELPEANPSENEANLGPDIDLLQDIEIKLCEVCERYEAILDNNPHAKPSFKDYFKPLQIEIVGYIKSARLTIYSYC